MHRDALTVLGPREPISGSAKTRRLPVAADCILALKGLIRNPGSGQLAPPLPLSPGPVVSGQLAVGALCLRAMTGAVAASLTLPFHELSGDLT